MKMDLFSLGPGRPPLLPRLGDGPDTINKFHGLGARLWGVSLLNESERRRKSVNFRTMVGNIENRLVSQQGGIPFIEDEGVAQQLYNPLGSKGGGMKLCYLEERDEGELSKRILGLSRTNKRKSAMQLFRSMEFARLRPDLHACNSLLACLSRNRMLDDMLRVFAFMKREKIISGHSCSLVLKAVASYRGSDKALQIFNEWEIESEMKQCFDAIVYNTMISICSKENNWVQMERIWNSLKENGVTGTEVTYRLLVCTFVRCGQYEMAIQAYAEMLQNGLNPGRDTMHAVIGAYTKEEKWDLALNVFQSMLNCGLKPNLIACNSLINSLGKAGKLKEAFGVYKHMKSLGHTPDSYTWNALLAAFYKTNQYAFALQFFESIQKDWSFEPNLQLYNTALMCCQRLGFWEKALQFLWKMENSGMLVSTSSYNIVIGACEVARKPKVALQVYKHMVQQKCAPDTFTHLSLIRSCIWGDLWDEVEDILNQESSLDVSLYNAAIHGMCLRGRIESAKRLYLKLRDVGLVPDGKTRALMLQYLQRVNSRLLKKSRSAIPAKRQRRGGRS
ncbi:pentatricopeptide repeat-containing protein At3g29290-like isoform X1 [Chenopodium quinoa]|uniref:pentatricopeptide repeat-containing protein At3g29290-like isoform X1 n=1 Tax=Chenopodium quinoa TaxID=63459 RepID=UPI000B7717FA|nr:pentatricopeptide repeat-containing protein At3g29290-like isoform X1 [Chenopodium quinoa]